MAKFTTEELDLLNQLDADERYKSLADVPETDERFAKLQKLLIDSEKPEKRSRHNGYTSAQRKTIMRRAEQAIEFDWRPDDTTKYIREYDKIQISESTVRKYLYQAKIRLQENR